MFDNLSSAFQNQNDVLMMKNNCGYTSESTKETHSSVDQIIAVERSPPVTTERFANC